MAWEVTHGCLVTVEKISSAGGSPEECDGAVRWRPMAPAAIHGQKAIVRLLWRSGVDICRDKDWLNPPIRILRRLRPGGSAQLSVGPDENDQGLGDIFRIDNQAALRLLLDLGLNPLVLKGSLLRRAAGTGDANYAELLLQAVSTRGEPWTTVEPCVREAMFWAHHDHRVVKPLTTVFLGAAISG
ncbi:hypothetical protein BJX61DRAFT_538642 [Aspergillus egyptiacus]|nr:hypothetical protein BJX61DRAFT_538642 [Aspergillus egyptiacus]